MKKNKQKGFTLIEILVVIAIIGLLSTFAVIYLQSAREKAKVAKAKQAIDQIFKAIQILAVDTTEWPGHQTIDSTCVDVPPGNCSSNEICGPDKNGDGCANGLTSEIAGLIQDDITTPYSNWQGPYMLRIPLDPWGYEYFFDTDYSIDVNNDPCKCTNTGCHDATVIGSYGPDGITRPTGGAAYDCNDIIKVIW